MANVRASYHFSKVLEGTSLKYTIDKSVEILSELNFDTVAFIGLSGALVAPIVAYRMNKELLMIRKHGGQDRSNSGKWIEGNHGAKRVVIIDDLTSSGRTMSAVMHAMRHLQAEDSPEIKVVGVLLHYCLQLREPGEPDFRRSMETEKEYPHPVSGVLVDVSNLPPLWDSPSGVQAELTATEMALSIKF